MTKKILSSTGYLSATSIIEKVGGFILIPILTTTLTSKDYGALMLAISYMGIIILFIYNGLHSALFRWYSIWNENFDKKIYEKYIFYIVNLIGFSMMFFLLFIHVEIYNLDSVLKLNFWLFITVLVANILNIGYTLKSSVWVIDNKPYLNLIFTLIKTVFLVIGVYLLLPRYPYSITKPIIEIVILFLMSLYFIHIYITKYPSINSVSFNRILPILKESFIYGWGLQISQIAFWIITSSDRIFLANLINNESVAYYSVLMIGTTIMFVITAFNNSFSVYYNKMIVEKISFKKINNYLFTYLLYGFTAIFIYKIFLYFLAYYIILLLATKEYLIISKYMYLTSDILLFYFAYLLFSRYLHAYKMVKLVIATTIIAALLNIGLNYILIPEYYILGALIASIISYFSMSVISFWWMYKKMEFKYLKNLMLLFITISIIDFIIDLLLYKGMN